MLIQKNQSSFKNSLNQRRTAFTLMEVMVVVAIIVILAGVATVSISRQYAKAQQSKARMDIDAIDKAIKLYQLDNGGSLPTSLQELIQSTDGGEPYLQGGPNALLDPWKRPYQYSQQQINGAERGVVRTTPPSPSVSNLKETNNQ